MKQKRIMFYDAFTTERFCGNIAGVVPDSEGLTPAEMQAIASELGAPTTGFAGPVRNGRMSLAFYTPTMEIDMCGHVVVGVLSALHDLGRLGDLGRLDEGPANLDITVATKAGDLDCSIVADGDRDTVLLRQNLPLFKSLDVETAQVADILGIEEADIDASLPIEMASTALRHMVVPVRNIETLERLRPDFEALAALNHRHGIETTPVFAFTPLGSGVYLQSRDLCPAIGNNEEAASGTTNGALACYLHRHKRLPGDGDSVEYRAAQGIEMGRPSKILCKLLFRDGEVSEVWVGGAATQSLSGEIIL